MALFTAQAVKDLAAELLKTSTISNDTINNIYIPLMTSEVLDRLAPFYNAPLTSGGVVIPDEEIPRQVYNAVLFKVTALAIVNNYADKANNQEALGVAAYYDRKADGILNNIAPLGGKNPSLILTGVDGQAVAETVTAFIVDDGDEIDDRAVAFLHTLDRRFY